MVATMAGAASLKWGEAMGCLALKVSVVAAIAANVRRKVIVFIFSFCWRLVCFRRFFLLSYTLADWLPLKPPKSAKHANV